MNIEKKLVVIALTAVLIASMFGIATSAAQPEKANPLDKIWTAITNLQDRVKNLKTSIFGLQTIINTRSPKTNRIAFSPADFGQYQGYIESGNLVAPVHLPNGVRITSVGYSIYDGSTGWVNLHLIHLVPEVQNELDYPQAFVRSPVADLFSETADNGLIGYHVQSVSPIVSESIVKNSVGPYFFSIEVEGSTVVFYNAFIEYEYVD